MKRNATFPRFLVLLLLIAGVAGLAEIPRGTVNAQESTITIVDNSIKIYYGDTVGDIITVSGSDVTLAATATEITAANKANVLLRGGQYIVFAVTFSEPLERAKLVVRFTIGGESRESHTGPLQEGHGWKRLYNYGPMNKPNDWQENRLDDSEWATLYFPYQVKPADAGLTPFAFETTTPTTRPFWDGTNHYFAFNASGVENNSNSQPTLTLSYTGTVHWPAGISDDTTPPMLASTSEFPVVQYVDAVGEPIEAAPRGAPGQPSRYHHIRQKFVQHQGSTSGSSYIAVTEGLVEDSGYSTSQLGQSDIRKAAYWREDDTIRIQFKFSENVKVDLNNKPTLKLDGEGTKGRLATLKDGDGTGDSDTLTFEYTVQAGDDNFGGIHLWSGFGHNVYQIFPWESGGPVEVANPSYITDVVGNKFDMNTDIETPLRAYLGNNDTLTRWNAETAAERAADTYKITLFLVDSIRPRVLITGLIKGDTHTNGRRDEYVRLQEAYDLADVTESATQTEAFEVEFRFFNSELPGAPSPNGYRVSAIAEEIGTSFEPSDVEISGAGVNPADWEVAVAYIGVDHRKTDDGRAHNSASFLVYKATITPALGFRGDVAIRLPAGATQDIAGNDSLASNTLTVPVDNPLRVVETPEIVAPPAGAYTAGDKIEVEVTYDRENLRYEGDNPPYLTLYLGEEVPANARHATWQRAEDTNSTKVTFAYTVAGTDKVAETVRVPSVEILVPEDTTLLSGPLTAPDEQQSGTEEAAAGSGAAPKTVPAVEPLPSEDTSGRQVSPVVSDTPVVPYTPILEETAPKAAASDVPRSPIVFNELGNGSGNADDWLELRNVTGSAVSLKDWELSVVQDGKKEDTSLILFPDVSVPAKGLLLIVNSAPDKTPLAAGDDITTSDVEKKGSPHRYLVNSGLSLPDDGKFLLILRKTKEKLGLNEAFVDVAGGGGSDTDAFVREQTGDYDTHVWPLQVLQAPGGDTEDALGSGKVWQRAKADIVGYHKDAWAESAFTGIGYDRKVSASPATAGTPGYPNVAAKETAAKGSVTFSEIMVDSAGGTLPQWIELYNASKTDAVNLNRWKLEIQNVDSEDLVGRPIVTLTLGEKVIQPNQTLLIVAGPARASSGSYLPADRVYDLLALHEKNLRIKRARDTFLSTEGFYLKLTDRDRNLVDEVGNRDSDRRSDDAPAWAFPLSSEEGSRSSLIRRYTDGTSAAEPGQKRSSWVSAARVKKIVSSSDALYWGDADDIGTPGHREGGALPVELSSFSVTRTEAGAVVLTWTTESEVDNAGFNLRRSEKRASGFTLLNPALIAGAGTTGERQTYTFTDTSAKPGIEYYYQIEEVAFDGKPETLVTRLLPGPVSAVNRMLTTFGALKKRE